MFNKLIVYHNIVESKKSKNY